MHRNLKLCFVVGARPNFMKIAPIIKALDSVSEKGSPSGEDRKLEYIIVHTGQHYDKNMSEVFFRDLGIPEPDWNLEVGSGSHAQQTADVMIAFEEVLYKERPDVVIVVGDVNSTIACSLTAKKLHIKVAHVEAGLRSFDEAMPEEINRRLTDSISDLLFVTEQAGLDNLLREGINEKRVHFVGNVMIDTLMECLRRLDECTYFPREEIVQWTNLHEKYAVLTLHRPSNVDDRETLTDIWSAIEEIADQIPVLFPIHPRTRKQMEDFGLPLNGVNIVEPIGYVDMLYAVKRAALVMTDSGGLQEETTAMGIHCLTIRENTERPVTIDVGTNYLVGTESFKIRETADLILKGYGKKGEIPPLWDGRASERIVRILADLVP